MKQLCFTTFTEAKLPKLTMKYGTVSDSPEIVDKYCYIKGKLIRRSLIQGVFFDESLTIYEDLYFDMILKSKLENYVFLKKPFYHYYQSILSSVNQKGEQHRHYLQAIEKIKPLFSTSPDSVRNRVYSLLYKNAILTILFKLRTQKGKAENLKEVQDALIKLDSMLPDAGNNPLICILIIWHPVILTDPGPAWK